MKFSITKKCLEASQKEESLEVNINDKELRLLFQKASDYATGNEVFCKEANVKSVLETSIKLSKLTM